MARENLRHRLRKAWLGNGVQGCTPLDEAREQLQPMMNKMLAARSDLVAAERACVSAYSACETTLADFTAASHRAAEVLAESEKLQLLLARLSQQEAGNYGR